MFINFPRDFVMMWNIIFMTLLHIKPTTSTATIFMLNALSKRPTIKKIGSSVLESLAYVPNILIEKLLVIKAKIKKI